LSFEDFTPIKVFLPCGGPMASGGGSWRSPMVVGAEGGGLGFWVRVWEKERGEKRVLFTLLSYL